MWGGGVGLWGGGGCSELPATKQHGLRKQAAGDPRLILSCRCFSSLYIDQQSERSFERGPLTVKGDGQYWGAGLVNHSIPLSQIWVIFEVNVLKALGA